MSNEQKHSISRSWNNAKRAQTMDHWAENWSGEKCGKMERGKGGRRNEQRNADTDAATARNESHCQNSEVIANRQTRALSAKECEYVYK